MTDGTRRPSPDKLLPLKEWQLPQTLAALRGRLGLANYFSEYGPSYASFAAPLMKNLKLGRVEGKKGSMVKIKRDHKREQAFRELKIQLVLNLFLFQPDHTLPFMLYQEVFDFTVGKSSDKLRRKKKFLSDYTLGSLLVVG